MARYIVIFIIAIALTLTSAIMNISGYISLYSESATIIAVIFITLELTKAAIFGIALVTASSLQKRLLVSFATLLLIISFLGHLSFLSRAYNINKTELENSTTLHTAITDSSKSQIEIIDAQISQLKNSLEISNSELTTIQNNIQAYKDKPNSSNWVYTSNKKRIQEIMEHNKNITEQINSLYQQKQKIVDNQISQAKQVTEVASNIASRSAFTYTASIFNTTQDRLASIINIVLSLAIDPLALIMLWTGTSLLNNRKETDIPNSTPESDIIQNVSHETSISDNTTDLSEVKNIDTSNCHLYKYKGYTLEDILKMDVASINKLKYTISNKQGKDWLDACISIRSNRALYKVENNHKGIE